MRRAALLLSTFLWLAFPVSAQITISGPATISGDSEAQPGVAPPTGTECNLPLSFAGNQGTNCMKSIFHIHTTATSTWDRRTEIAYPGHDALEQKLTTDCNGDGDWSSIYAGVSPGCGPILAAIPPGTAARPGAHPAAVLTGQQPQPTKPTLQAWVAKYRPAGVEQAFGDGETCVEWADSEVNQVGCGGVGVLITEGTNQVGPGTCGAADGFAYAFVACEGKGSDTMQLMRINMCTGAVTAPSGSGAPTAVNTSPAGAIDVYGGSPLIGGAHADHNRGQPDWHMYIAWTQVCLRLETVGTQITLTGRAWLTGPQPWASYGANARPRENNDPGPPSGVVAYPRTLIGTATATVTRATTVPATGPIGIVGWAGSGTVQEASVTNLRWSETPQP